MPELPEVETVRRDLSRRLLGKKIKNLKVFSDKTVASAAAVFYRTLKGQSFVDFDRRGKLLIITLSPANLFLLIHLKMTGQLIYRSSTELLAGGHSLGESDVVNLPNKHTRVAFYFNDGSQLFFNDMRKFGYVKLANREELDRIIAAGYGPEPLTKSFTIDSLTDKLRTKKVNIKAALLNQKNVAGLGNIYVDEVLFAAGIRPQRLANSLRAKELALMYQVINDILKKAISYKGTTFRDFVDTKGQKGNFSKHLQVYGRAGQPCAICRRPITKIKLTGRGTHYCERCQR